MKLSLTKGLGPDEKKGLENSFNNSGVFRERLKEVLLDKAELTLSLSQYDKASWPFYHADQIGYIRAIKEIISLIETKD